MPGRLAALVLFLQLVPAAALSQQQSNAAKFDVYEATIADLQAALGSGRVTSVQLVDAYMDRIRTYDQSGPRLNAVLAINVNARIEAAALDADRSRGHIRGPLHGIPILIKDNIDVRGMQTTAASFALVGSVPVDDAYIVRRLRAAGAIVLGKANMHELSLGITNVSSLHGQTRNPYNPEHNPGGSSGGTGASVAASYAAIGYATDTCGSIRIPAAFNALFGLRPTKGLISTNGVLPLSRSQDAVGPLARTVTDMAIGLDAVTGFDETDPATWVLQQNALPRFVEGLRTASLRNTRIGVLTEYMSLILFSDDLQDIFDRSNDVSNDRGNALLSMLQNSDEGREARDLVLRTLERMKELGAEIVELSIPKLDSLLTGSSAIDHEFKFDLQDYLAKTPAAPIDSLGDILVRGLYHPSVEGILRRTNAPQSRDSEAYRRTLARRQEVRDTVLAVLARERLDAIAYPTMRRGAASIGERQRGSTCQLSATTGLPALSMPAGFTSDGLPVGIELLGGPLEDAKLVGFAYLYEQAYRPRLPPAYTPSLLVDR